MSFRTLLSLVFVVFVLALTREAKADPDPWFSGDKAAHFGVSAAIASGSYAIGRATLFKEDRTPAVIASAAFTLAIGAGKECADLAGLGNASWKDFAWDGIGMVTGLLIAWGIDLLLINPPRHSDPPRRALAP